MTQMSPSPSSADARSVRTTAPVAVHAVSRVRTTLRRPGSGRTVAGSDSQVTRPITTVDPMVSRLNSARSSGRCQGKPPSRPMTPLVACAQMREINVRLRSHRDGCAERGVVLVADDAEVLEGVVEQGRRLAQL